MTKSDLIAALTHCPDNTTILIRRIETDGNLYDILDVQCNLGAEAVIRDGQEQPFVVLTADDL